MAPLAMMILIVEFLNTISAASESNLHQVPMLSVCFHLFSYLFSHDCKNSEAGTENTSSKLICNNHLNTTCCPKTQNWVSVFLVKALKQLKSRKRSVLDLNRFLSFLWISVLRSAAFCSPRSPWWCVFIGTAVSNQINRGFFLWQLLPEDCYECDLAVNEDSSGGGELRRVGI